MPERCFWVPPDDDLYIAYHDHEWGFPVAEDRRLFEKLCLEGFQAGLSWRTVLGRREAFREAFAGFDMERVAAFDGGDVERLMADRDIIRNRAKIEAAVANAGCALEIVAEEGSLAAHVWRFAPTAEDRPARVTEEHVRSTTTSPAARALAADLRDRGWRFIGPTTAHAFMQAVGLVNDHTEDCHVRPRAAAARASFTPPA